MLSAPALNSVGRVHPVVRPNVDSDTSLSGMLRFLIVSKLDLPRTVTVLIPRSFGRGGPVDRSLGSFCRCRSVLVRP